MIQLALRNKLLVFFCTFVLGSYLSKAQDATVYVSPHDIDKTLSNIYFSIDRGGHNYLTTRHVKSQRSADTISYTGKLAIVEFEIKDFNKIISCEPTVALENPMKIVIWEEDDDVYIAYTSPHVYKRRYFLSGCQEALQSVNKSMIRIVNEAIRTH